MFAQEHAIIPSILHMLPVIPISHSQYAQFLSISPRYWLEKWQYMWLFLGYIWACWCLNCSSLLMDQMNCNKAYPSALILICVFPLYFKILKCDRNIIFMQHSQCFFKCAWKLTRDSESMRKEGKRRRENSKTHKPCFLSCKLNSVPFLSWVNYAAHTSQGALSSFYQ